MAYIQQEVICPYSGHLVISKAVYNERYNDSRFDLNLDGYPIVISPTEDAGKTITNVTCDDVAILISINDNSASINFPDVKKMYTVNVEFSDGTIETVRINVIGLPVLVNLTEAQMTDLVVNIFNTVNSRISERIVQSITSGDTKHVASNDAIAAAVAKLEADIAAASGASTDNLAASKQYTDDQIQDITKKIMDMNHWDIVPVTGDLPDDPDEHTIYLQRSSETDQTWEMNIITTAEDGTKSWINVGNTAIDLANYWSKDNVDGIVNALFSSDLFKTRLTENINTILSEYTESTLDARYWGKEEVEQLAESLLSEESFKAGVLSSMADTYVNKTRLKDMLAVIEGIFSEEDSFEEYTVENEDGTKTTYHADGSTTTIHPDGSVTTIRPQGQTSSSTSSRPASYHTHMPTRTVGSKPGHIRSPKYALYNAMLNMGMLAIDDDTSMDKLITAFGRFFPHRNLIAKLREDVSEPCSYNDGIAVDPGLDNIYLQLKTIKDILKVDELNRDTMVESVNQMVSDGATRITDDQISAIVSRANLATQPNLA